jgi:hypothetical protein
MLVSTKRCADERSHNASNNFCFLTAKSVFFLKCFCTCPSFALALSSNERILILTNNLKIMLNYSLMLVCLWTLFSCLNGYQQVLLTPFDERGSMAQRADA